MKTSIASLVIALSLAAGCSAPVQHPGAVSTFDSTTYDALTVAQAAIEQAKTSFGPTPSATIKTLLNNAITAYNVAEAAYMAYHQAAVAGTATPAAQTGLQMQLVSMNASIAALKGAK